MGVPEPVAYAFPTTLSEGISSTDTEMTLDDTNSPFTPPDLSGDKYSYAVICKDERFSDVEADYETVKVTGESEGVFTIERDVESTDGPKAWDAGDFVMFGITAKGWEDLADEASSVSEHGNTEHEEDYITEVYEHGNEVHDQDYIHEVYEHGNEVHDQDYITEVYEHGDDKHSEDYLKEQDPLKEPEFRRIILNESYANEEGFRYYGWDGSHKFYMDYDGDYNFKTDHSSRHLKFQCNNGPVLEVGSGEIEIDGSEIQDMGSNNDGYWVKFYNGLMFQWKQSAATVNIDTSMGEGWTCGTQDWDFPADFDWSHDIAMYCEASEVVVWGAVADYAGYQDDGWRGLRGFSFQDQGDLDIHLSAFGIGRWK